MFKTLDYNQRLWQLTDTIAYCEVIFAPDNGVYLVVWHDNILGEYATFEEALSHWGTIVFS